MNEDLVTTYENNESEPMDSSVRQYESILRPIEQELSFQAGSIHSIKEEIENKMNKIAINEANYHAQLQDFNSYYEQQLKQIEV